MEIQDLTFKHKVKVVPGGGNPVLVESVRRGDYGVKRVTNPKNLEAALRMREKALEHLHKLCSADWQSAASRIGNPRPAKRGPGAPTPLPPGQQMRTSRLIRLWFLMLLWALVI